MANIGLGYAFNIKDKYRIIPSFEFGLGLNEIGDDTINPSVLALAFRLAFL